MTRDLYLYLKIDMPPNVQNAYDAKNTTVCCTIDQILGIPCVGGFERLLRGRFQCPSDAVEVTWCKLSCSLDSFTHFRKALAVHKKQTFSVPQSIRALRVHLLNVFISTHLTS